MRFHGWLARVFPRRIHVEASSSTPRELGAEELVSRVIYSRRHFSPSTGRAKPNAFNPFPHNELSTIYITGLGDLAIWKIARSTVGTQPGRDTIYARADVPVKEFLREKLKTILDNKSFERHTSIVGWPDMDDPNQRKECWKEICVKLSESPETKLVIRHCRLDRGSTCSMLPVP